MNRFIILIILVVGFNFPAFAVKAATWFDTLPEDGQVVPTFESQSAPQPQDYNSVNAPTEALLEVVEETKGQTQTQEPPASANMPTSRKFSFGFGIIVLIVAAGVIAWKKVGKSLKPE